MKPTNFIRIAAKASGFASNASGPKLASGAARGALAIVAVAKRSIFMVIIMASAAGASPTWQLAGPGRSLYREQIDVFSPWGPWQIQEGVLLFQVEVPETDISSHVWHNLPALVLFTPNDGAPRALTQQASIRLTADQMHIRNANIDVYGYGEYWTFDTDRLTRIENGQFGSPLDRAIHISQFLRSPNETCQIDDPLRGGRLCWPGYLDAWFNQNTASVNEVWRFTGPITPSITNTPEPSAAMLLCLAVVLFLSQRR